MEIGQMKIVIKIRATILVLKKHKQSYKIMFIIVPGGTSKPISRLLMYS